MNATVTHTVGCPEYVTIIRDAALTALGISFAVIDSAGGQRRGKASDCRAIIAYILRKQAYASWNEIAQAVGVSSHASVMTAYQNVNDRPKLKERADAIADQVRGIVAGTHKVPVVAEMRVRMTRPSLPISLLEVDHACAEAIAEAVGDCEWRQLPIEERDMYVRAWRAAWAVHRAAME